LTSRGKQRVPWTELQRAQNESIELEYLPEQVTLKQYYHLCRDDVSAILKHWTWRQAAGEVSFHFKMVAVLHQNRPMPEGTDGDTDVESSEEEMNLVNSDGSWGQGDESQDGSINSAAQAHPSQSHGTATGAPSRVS
jgi:hypothetical protein